jgi:hypothetical protein
MRGSAGSWGDTVVARSRKKGPAEIFSVSPSPLCGEMIATLNDVFDRVECGETLALAVIEIRREDIISQVTVGQYDGWRHKLIAGTVYLKSDLLADDDAEYD